MLYSSYPKVVDPDSSSYSATLAYHDALEKTFSTNAYMNLPDYPSSGFFNTDSIVGHSSTSTDAMSSDFPTTRSFNPTLPATGIPAVENQQDFRPTFYTAPFGQLQQYQSGYALDPTSINSVEPGPFSPISRLSRTPSLCGDGQQQEVPASPWLSPQSVKRESTISTASIEDETTSTRPQRKRGRPRLEPTDTGPQSSGSPSTRGQRAGRLPHNQVERKYREGLNAELERLRKAVPTLPQSEDGGRMGQPKPSKAMVLAGAIDYIKRIEKERDALLDEVDRLKQLRRQSTGWTRDDECLDDFLMEP